MLTIPESGSDLQNWFRQHTGLELDSKITDLRDQQREALEWLVARPEPYLFVNAPTGSGKTLLAMTYGALRQRTTTYAVHTISLQEQVARTFENLPILTGRRNHPCWVGEDIYGVPDEYTADQGACVLDAKACEHSPKGLGQGGFSAQSDEDEDLGLCPYYTQLRGGLWARHRITNYAMLLSYPPLQARTKTLLADEGHNVEEAVVGQASLSLNRRTLSRFGLRPPRNAGSDMETWAEWAADAFNNLPIPAVGGKPDFGYKSLKDTLGVLVGLSDADTGQWLVEESDRGVAFTPIWGRDFVMSRLFNHDEPPPNADAFEEANRRTSGIDKVILVSATLMGAEYIASTLGFPDGSWAYLDLPSTFPVANRPINYAPVAKQSYANREESRPLIQSAMDTLIEYYVLNGAPSGVIHAVSNEYRDNILSNSRWRGIMCTTPQEHEAKVANGEASVLVAANLMEGWDGADNLCRFILMPKVPFPSLGDKRTKIRMEEDSRSYDHRTLVSVVQGAGRGVRHREDYCDTWILDGSWQQLYARTKDWLPDSFKSAYHHRVSLV